MLRTSTSTLWTRVVKLEKLALQMEPLDACRCCYEDSVIVKHLEHYARDTVPDFISAILSRGTVQSEDEARAITDVIDVMYAHFDADEQSNTVVYRQPIRGYDADKVAETVHLARKHDACSS